MNLIESYNLCYDLLGEMERTFLVLRESVAMARLKAKDQARAGPSVQQAQPTEQAPAAAQQTGTKPQPASPQGQAPQLNMTQPSTSAGVSSGAAPIVLTPIVNPVSSAVPQSGLLGLNEAKEQKPSKSKESKKGKDKEADHQREHRSKSRKRDVSPDQVSSKSSKRR